MTTPSRLTIELLEHSQNSNIRDMFHNEKAGEQIDAFVAKHHLHLQKEGLGQPTGIVLTGKLADLEDFIKTFLSADSGRGVYHLDEIKE